MPFGSESSSDKPSKRDSRSLTDRSHQCLSAASPLRTRNLRVGNHQGMEVTNAFRQRVLFGHTIHLARILEQWSPMPFGSESSSDTTDSRRVKSELGSHQCLSAASPLRTFVGHWQISLPRQSVTNAFRQRVLFGHHLIHSVRKTKTVTNAFRQRVLFGLPPC